MKYLLILSVLTPAPLVASAGNIYCTEGKSPSSSSYVVTVASDSQTAHLDLPSVGDFWSSRTLHCRALPVRFPEDVFLSCAGGNPGEPAYLFEVGTGGSSARLERVGDHGVRPIANLNCQYL